MNKFFEVFMDMECIYSGFWFEICVFFMNSDLITDFLIHCVPAFFAEGNVERFLSFEKFFSFIQ